MQYAVLFLSTAPECFHSYMRLIMQMSCIDINHLISLFTVSDNCCLRYEILLFDAVFVAVYMYITKHYSTLQIPYLKCWSLPTPISLVGLRLQPFSHHHTDPQFCDF